MELKKLVYGVTWTVMLFLSSFMGTVILITPMLPIAFFSPQLSRRGVDFLMQLWFMLAVALYELLMGVKIVVKGKPPRRGTSTLILANHRCRLDWLFFMSYVVRYNTLLQYKICLKEELKHIPGAGWAMQCAGFLFLKRRWEQDKSHISNGLRHFSKVKSKPQFLLFPEGTDLSDYSIPISKRYALKQGLPVYEYVLHPRTTGFVHFVNEMKKGEIVDSVLDVTVGYQRTIIQTEGETMLGQFPEEIHVYIKDYPIDTLPTSEEELEQWLKTLWSEKEARLEKFYRDKYFETDDCESDTASPVKPLSDLAVKRRLYAVITFWVVFLAAAFIGLIFYPIFRWIYVIVCVVYIVVGMRFGGVDSIIFTKILYYG